jgi:hypothetical protein
MKTVAIISVGNDYKGVPYYTQCVENVKQLIDVFGFDVRLLTDTPKEFEGLGCSIYKYDKKIFSYFDKFFFSFKLIKELNKSVTYIDCDCIDYLLKIEKFRNLESQNKVLYLTYWSVKNSKEWVTYQFLKDFKFDIWSHPLLEFFEMEKYDISKLETMHERLLYFPVGLDYDNVQYELEKIKPVFEYMSLYSINLNNRLIFGHGEGLALSYALDVNNIGKEKLEDQMLFRERYDVIFQDKSKTLI